jgi:flagellar FliL protein
MAEEATEEGRKKKGKLGIIIPVVVLVLGLGGGGFMFMSGSKKGAATGPPTTTTTAPGPIIRLDPLTMNLTDGHVLKVGLALEALAKPKDKEMATVVAALSASGEGHAASGSTTSPMEGLEAKALDLAIKDLGNKSYAELSAPHGRVEAQEELQKDISEAYHGDIVEIYFTTFVMS